MWKKIFSKKTNENDRIIIGDYASAIDPNRVPKHIAIIMDGNGRWAQQKGLLRSLGHKAGVETLKDIVKAADNMGISVLTAYAFSTENWKRPQEEVAFLMKLFAEYLAKEIDDLDRDNVKIQFIGRIHELSEGLQDQVENAQKRTEENTGLILNLAVNYGSRDEITHSVKIIAKRVLAGEIGVDQITEKIVEGSLYTAELPDVDLVIRPSGDLRISNFLLWQIAYAELWFTDINWPDFKPENLYQAVYDYQQRDRRFGGLNKTKSK